MKHTCVFTIPFLNLGRSVWHHKYEFSAERFFSNGKLRIVPFNEFIIIAGRALYLKQKISFKFLQVIGIQGNYEVLHTNTKIL